ncbi:M50 family metallopeptidase [Mycoplasmatota bacterium]|nr:M50 family metallopeptidase [Mycoplasmatota bacterium]
MEHSKKKKNKNNWMLQWTLCIIGFIGWLYVLKVYSVSNFYEEHPMLYLIYFFISYFITLNIHEFGHYLFGRMLGFELITYRFSIFLWKMVDSKIRFTIVKPKGYGCYCVMIPPKGHTSRGKDILFTAGGIIINFITGIIVLLLLMIFDDIPKFIEVFILMLGFLSIFFALFNLIPLYIKNNPNDGRCIINIILNKPIQRIKGDISVFITQLSSGIRPRDIQISHSYNIEYLFGANIRYVILLYYKALDENNIEKMMYYIDFLEKNIKIIPVPLQRTIIYEICYIGCITNNFEKVKKYYTQIEEKLQKDNDINGLRIKAYYEYYINRKVELPLQYCQDALSVIDEFPYKGLALMEIELINVLKNIIITENNL